MHQSVKLVFWNVDLGLGLAKEGDDGLSRVSTNDRDDGLRWVFSARDILYESLRADHIECRHTEEALGVEDTGLFHDLGSNWDG